MPIFFASSEEKRKHPGRGEGREIVVVFPSLGFTRIAFFFYLQEANEQPRGGRDGRRGNVSLVFVNPVFFFTFIFRGCTVSATFTSRYGSWVGEKVARE